MGISRQITPEEGVMMSVRSRRYVSVPPAGVVPPGCIDAIRKTRNT